MGTGERSTPNPFAQWQLCPFHRLLHEGLWRGGAIDANDNGAECRRDVYYAKEAPSRKALSLPCCGSHISRDLVGGACMPNQLSATAPPPSLYWSLRLQAVRVHCAAVTLTGLGVAFAALQRPEDIVATLEKLVSKTTIEKMCAPGGTHADHRVAWAQRRRANLFRLQGVRIPPTMFVACLPSPSTPMD